MKNSDWIKVEDMLPKDFQDCLIITDQDFLEITTWMGHKEAFMFYGQDMYGFKKCHVKYWMSIQIPEHIKVWRANREKNNI